MVVVKSRLKSEIRDQMSDVRDQMSDVLQLYDMHSVR